MKATFLYHSKTVLLRISHGTKKMKKAVHFIRAMMNAHTYSMACS